jgi:hypothetical protein
LNEKADLEENAAGRGFGRAPLRSPPPPAVRVHAPQPQPAAQAQLSQAQALPQEQRALSVPRSAADDVQAHTLARQAERAQAEVLMLVMVHLGSGRSARDVPARPGIGLARWRGRPSS